LLKPALVVLLAVGSGTLECGGPQVTPKETLGERHYKRMCAVCHGPTGRGYAADQAPSLTRPQFLATVEDTYLRTAILEGRSGTTMSAWSAFRGGPLLPADADALIAYLRSYADRPPAKLDDSPVKGDAAHGEKLFEAECARCHGPHGSDGVFLSIGNPELLKSASSGFLRDVMRNGREGTPMPAYGESLGHDGVEDVLAALRQWQKTPGPARKPAAKPPPLPLGPVPLNPHGPEPDGFAAHPQTTKVDVVKAALDHGAKLALLDARAQSDYLQEHIAGAVSVPFYDPEPYLAQLPKDAWLVSYCSCPHAESRTLAGKLVEKGFTKVTVLDEGLRVWKSKGYATHVGMDP
jgi:cytochrome c oxidase cbb3-type subunit 3